MVDTCYGMFNLTKIVAYQREAALGLSALALLLMIMSFTGSWTLMKIIGSLRENTQHRLSTAALEIARNLERAGSSTGLGSVRPGRLPGFGWNPPSTWRSTLRWAG